MRPVEVEDGRVLCRGVLHRQGIWLPLSEFYTRKEGGIIRPCKKCRLELNAMSNRRRLDGLVDAAYVDCIIDELLVYYHTKRAICEELGWHRSMLKKRGTRYRKSTFKKLIQLMHGIEELDGLTHQRSGDAEVVRGEDIGAVIRRWSREFLVERPITNFGNQPFSGPVDVLSEHSGVNARRISGITAGEIDRISVGQADDLLRAMGMEHLLVDGTIPVIRNPTWSVVDWYNYMEEKGCV